MTVVSGTLRSNFPEFSNKVKYTDAQVNFWLSIAYLQLPPNVWGEQLDFGVQLFTAHNLTLAAKNQAAAQFDGVPGQSSGPITSKSVDKVSVSYAANLAAQDGAGYYNQSTYGQQFYRIAMMMGAGPRQINGPQVNPGFAINAGLGPSDEVVDFPQW